MAGSGAEAQALIAAAAGAYDAVVCDLRMPDIDGPALFHWIKANHPALVERMLVRHRRCAGTGGRALPVPKSGRPFLEKPFTPADVARLVADFPRAASKPFPETIEMTVACAAQSPRCIAGASSSHRQTTAMQAE